MARKLWNEEELILTLDLYFKLPFGRLNRNTREVIELAQLIGRTNNSVALRLVNFAACDPYIIESGRTGMPAGIPVCMPIWERYANNRSQLYIDAEQIRAKYKKVSVDEILNIDLSKVAVTERESVVKQRIHQNVFRTMVLANYENSCAITGINVPELLIASHIIPWRDDEEKRLMPENGICLSPLYDKVFDIGLITIRSDYTIAISKELKAHSKKEYYQNHFGIIENKRITLPIEHRPNVEYLNYHYNKIFSPHN
ncbi:MAG: HNH endonuclease [Muribaculaceae bacterium]|nr:HNH endonuclease [Muribaculaceae bacterium]